MRRRGPRKRTPVGVAVVAASALILMLAACGGADGEGEEPAADQTESEEVTEEPEETSEGENAEGDGEAADVDFSRNPVRIFVGHGVGGSTDAIVRPIQQALQEELGTEVVIENVEGGGGMVAAQQVYTAEPDGHQLYAMVTPAYILQDLFGDQAPDFQEFEYIHRFTAGDTNGLATAPGSDIQSLDDLEGAAADGELLMSATSGLSNSTLGWALIIENMDVEFVHVPYESGGQALQAVLDGTTDTTLAAMASLREAYAADEVQIVTHFGEQDFEGLEDVERFGDRFDGASFGTEIGLIAPPGTPDDVVAALREAVGAAAESPSYTDVVSQIGQIDPMGGEEWAARVADQYGETEQLRPAIERILELQQQ